MKIIDARETQKKKQKTKQNKDIKEQTGTKAIVKGQELNIFVVRLS